MTHHENMRNANPVTCHENYASLQSMTTVLSPIESEFSTVEEAEAYDRWFRAKVQKSLDSKDPRRYSTDEVMQEMEQIIKAAEVRHAGSRMA